jgi:hypothetical protein
MNLQTIQNLPCNIKHIDQHNCLVTFTLPIDHVNAFVAMLSGMAGLFRGLAWKAKTNIDAIHERNLQKQKDIDALIAAYELVVCEMFKNYVNAGEQPRTAFSLTVSNIKKDFINSSYDNVKRVLTKNKLLKKTGFYKQSVR